MDPRLTEAARWLYEQPDECGDVTYWDDLVDEAEAETGERDYGAKATRRLYYERAADLVATCFPVRTGLDSDESAPAPLTRPGAWPTRKDRDDNAKS